MGSRNALPGHLATRNDLGGIALLALCGVAASSPGAAGTLPVPCAAAACAGISSWVSSGAASLAQSGNRMNITQTTNSATLNWQSFDISADALVNFNQPSSSSVSINKIFEADPSQIFGTLTSNGQVYLLNSNGFIFGPHAVVNVGGLVASSLQITSSAVKDGIAGAIADGQPAFAAVDANGNPIQNLGVIQIQSGASITSNQGEVLVLAPTVDNEGTIQTPSGQTILGGGQRVFLAVGSENGDPDVRGLLIAVGGSGTVTNGTSGEIISTAGDVTLAGLAVNQMGRVSATTTIDSNGSIRLEAQATTAQSSQTNFAGLSGFQSGSLILGSGSSTDVSLEGSSSETTVDATAQPASSVTLQGGEIQLLDGASIVAPHGNVTLTALGGTLINLVPSQQEINLTNQALQPDSSRIWLAPSSVIDVSGVTVSQAASLNSLAVQLNSVELADSPQQRNGPLHGQTVYVDIRQHGTLSNGTPWVGTPIADLTGDVSAIQHDVFQRSLTGGTITLNSSGSVIASPGATLNVSGGQIDWQSGYVKSSVLVGANGQLYPISAADPNLPYVGTLDTIDQSDPHWGSTAIFTQPGFDPRGTYQPAYVQGEGAGAVSIVAPAFVLDGNIEGSAVRGPLQVNPATAVPQNELYRYADQVPLGGQLTVGNSLTSAQAVSPAVTTAEVLQNLTFAPGPVLAGLSGPSGGAFDPAVDPLPSGFVSSLRPDILGAAGVSQLEVYAEGSITIPAGTQLDPGVGGTVSLQGGQIEDAGSIAASDGSVTLATVPTPLFGAGVKGTRGPATQLQLVPGASIDVSGTWVNQDPTLGPSAQAPLFTSGGTVQLLASDGGSLILPPGTSVNVNGGGQRTAAGALVAGTGGSIVITATSAGGLVTLNPQGVLQVDPALTGYALYSGGSLTLTLPALCVSGSACSVPSAYRIDPSYLTNYGFGKVSLASDGLPGGLTIEQDVNTDVHQLNLDFTSGSFNDPSQSSLEGLTQIVTLPQYLRQPESLTLSSTDLSKGSSVTYSDLTIAEGASLTFDPQATVSLQTDSRIFMNGDLTVPSGSISLAVSGDILDSTDQTVLADQAIWLGPDSSLNTNGTVVLTPNTLGLQIGSVLPGGTVSISAGRGYLLALPGSSILAAGTSAPIDESSPGSGAYDLETVASAGGSIELSASEGMQLDGTLAAPAGSGASAVGGSLSLTLNGDEARAANPAFDAGRPALDASRVLTVSASSAPTVIAEGSSVPDSLDGQGNISAATINSGGFDNVTLNASNLVGLVPVGDSSERVVKSEGVVAFDPGVSLSPRASLVIDSPELRASSGSVSLSSAYVALGSSDILTQQVNSTPVAGSASLSVTAQLIDLVGAMDLTGFGNATLSSSGDIRAVGVQLDPSAVGYSGNSGFTGLLVSPAALTLTAQQIYPTTLTSYDIDLTAGTAAQSTLTLTTAPGPAGAVLSAAGSLTLQANQILDSGVLRAPMGTINLTGETLPLDSGLSLPSTVQLSSGAVVSVSADGLTIPFGETQGGLDWTYSLRPGTTAGSGGVTVVYGTAAGDVAPPQKQVNITAADFQFSPGATIDVSGGGDLVAYEFVPGLGGTNDVLSTSYSSNTYAVIPGLKLPYAPVDPHEDIGFKQPVGSSVYLSGGDGLPAGTYTLLPARYALLPGAYLVKPVSGYTDLAPGQTAPQSDGSVVVSGYQTIAGTGLRDSRTSGWDVISGTYAYQEAQYTLTSANSFFAAQATSNQVTTPRLPQDAGALALQATAAADLQGTLLSSPADGGRGATVDFTASNLYVGSNPADAPAGASYVTVDPAQLNALGAESILLGATRSTTADSTDLSVSADNLVIGQDSVLTAPEVILAASGALDVESDAEIKATGSAVGAEPAFSAPSGTALLRVSSGPQVSLSYTTGSANSSNPAASLTVAQGATISASGSMSFDAGGAVDFEGSLSAANAAVRIGGNEIALGAVPSGFSGFAIGSSLLANLADSQLALDATAPIAVYGPVSLTLNTLDIAAPGLDVSQSGALDVTADSVSLSNPGSTVAPAVGTGSVTLDAAHVMLGNGTFAVTGAASAALTASTDLTATGSGTLETAGSLTLTSPVMQSASGQSFIFSAGAALTTALAATAAGSAPSPSGPGGSFTFDSTGASVQLGGNIVLPGGRVEATSEGGDVTVAAGATINVAGFSETFDNETESAAGGTVILSSTTGGVTIAPTATVDVSAGNGGGAGGTLSVVAPEGNAALDGQIQGAGASGQTGGSLAVQAQGLDFQSLLTLDQAGGFSGAFNVHELGQGSFEIGSGKTTTLQAADVELTADQGSITVDANGSINATTDLGGTILLAAGDNVVVNGILSAVSPTRADRGGTVKLYTTAGGIFVNSGSTISVGGTSANGATTSSGTLWLRAPTQSVLSVLGSDPLINLAGTITGAAHIDLEGYQTVLPDETSQGELIDSVVIGNANSAATQFMAQATPITGQMVGLGQANAAAFSVLPGIEIDSQTNDPSDPTGDLTVTDAWDFSPGNISGYVWSYGPNQNIPGVLTLRAAGSLNVDASISDGFYGTTTNGYDPTGYYNGFTLDPNLQTSWSYRLAAGSNLQSANPLAVSTDTSAGNLTLAPGGVSSPGSGATTPTMIRTGTGSIEIAAAGDLELDSQASVIYTAGAAYTGPAATVNDYNLGFQGLAYPVGGGDVSVNVGGDVLGHTSNQLFTDWLWRSGESGGSPVSWAPAYDYFEQGIGALGGGDLTVRAGGNIVDLGANVPSTGIPVTAASGAVTTTEANNGVLRISAGGDIEGGKFLDMAGQALVTAGGQITVGSDQSSVPGTGLYPVLALGGGQFTVTARGALSIDAIVDPTLLPVSAEEGSEDAIFSTYDDASRVTLTSVGGSVDFLNRTDGSQPLQQSSTNLSFFGLGLALYTLPPTLRAVALGGDVDLNGDIALWPSAHGNLDLLAVNSVVLDQTELRLSDADPSSLPIVTSPSPVAIDESGAARGLQNALDPVSLDYNQVNQSTANLPQPDAPQPVHGGAYAADGAPDLVPARVVALNGDVDFLATAASTTMLELAKPIDVIAGGDIINPNLYVQQFSSANTTNLIAGGNVTYSQVRDSSGNLLPNAAAITVAGPGRLDIQAGGTVDLGTASGSSTATSSGISTVGNLLNPVLPAEGADINVSAGINQAPQYQSFINTYLTQSDVYDTLLVQYVEQVTDSTGLDKAHALAALEGMSAEQQAPLLQQILFDELRTGGRAAAAAGPDHGDFASAFDALTTMFPGSNPDLAQNQKDPYSGDILLYFSRIYTVSGGNISLIAPGGLINVGLAVAPSAFGIQKSPDQLGVVAAQQGSINMVSYGDIDVNQSRVFAADGGDILMWSTEGNIDAGRGAKSAIAAPPPTLTINPNTGAVTEVFPPALTGSGIQALTTTPGIPPGSVDLFAPHGVVNANEAGIVAGNITIYAVQVLGANNISFSGTAVGVPVAVTGLGASLAAAGSSGSAASSVGESTVTQSSSSQNQAPQAQAALNWLDVFVLGLGEAQCAPDDLDCIKKQQMHH